MEQIVRDDYEIDRRGLMFSIRYHWRSILLAALVAGIATAGFFFKTKPGYDDYANEMAQAESELAAAQESYDAAYQNYSDALATTQATVDDQTSYMTNSILMNIDPNLEYYGHGLALFEIMLTDGSDRISALSNYYVNALLNGDYLDAIAAKYSTDTAYIKELIGVAYSGGPGRTENYETGEVADGAPVVATRTYQNGYLTFEVRTGDEAMSTDILQTMFDELSTLQTNYDAETDTRSFQVLEQSVTQRVDTGLAGQQQNSNSNLMNLNNQLVSNRNTLNSLVPPTLAEVKANPPKLMRVLYALYGLAGFAAGILVMMLFWALRYAMTDKIQSDTELTNRFRLRNAGSYPLVLKKRPFSEIDRWISKREGRAVAPDTAESETWQMIAVNVRNFASSIEADKSGDIMLRFAVAGSLNESEIEGIVVKFREYAPEYRYEAAPELLSRADSRAKLRDCDAVILTEARGRSRYSTVRSELQVIGDAGKVVLGTLTV